MIQKAKTLQLQIRVSPQEKNAIIRRARRAKMGISQWVLSQLLPDSQLKFQKLLEQLQKASDPKFILAEIHDLLHASSSDEFAAMVAQPPQVSLSPYMANYIAAMVEYSAMQKDIESPAWTRDIAPLDKPAFGSDLESLRLYLLTHSPVPFRNRNIFIDATIGGRV